MNDYIDFYKFDGAGNDFVVVDNRHERRTFDEALVARLCHRRFGVGADGLMTLEAADDGLDFEMVYYNSDGRIGSMCGNGGRCISAFAYLLGMGKRLHFKGFDGPHDAELLSWDNDCRVGIVRLGMRDVAVDGITRVLDGWSLDTGSPHYVQRVADLEHFDVVGEGRRLRHRTDLFPQGANVDFIEDLPDGRLAVRTYERGVEDETWACGTGVTACAIVSGNRSLLTRGGDFRVDFDTTPSAFSHVMLTGPVALNFTGKWKIQQND
ncbi:MAG: diaminopimelate epimerase [Bacteroidales bacterium]|nr:diaminopimelate epimerase [Bacteroidales bacterium]